ncbi:MAG TPA: efflux RND transporter periplasmic adaptor subunit [Pirellulales bacterium]|nr:efflux RND transporter periplasmic adaptor subunit [Pirellulales bacterium]
MASFVERNDPRRVPSNGTPASSITGSRRWPSWALAIALLAFAGIGLIYAWNAYAGQSPRGQPNDGHSANQSDDEDDSDGDSDEEDRARLKVKVVHPQKGGLVRTSTQPGVLHAFQYADLYAKASGYLTAQAVDIGDTVERGQLLAEIFDPEVQQRAEEAAAAVEQAKADIELAAARVVAAEAEVTAAEALVTQRKAQVGKYAAARKFREKEYIRYIELTHQRAIDYRLSDEKQDEYESALSAEKEAEAAVKTAEADLQRARAEVVRAKAAVASARANLRVREAAEKTAQIMAEYLQLTSPYNGVITNRNYHRGAFVRSADQGEQPPLLSVARTDLMRVVVYVRDQDVPFLDRGDKAVVRIDALRGEEFRGEVARYSEYEDAANRTMRAEIDLPNPTGRLREGMYGAVTILLEPPTDHLTVPSGALHERTQQGEGTVYVVEGHTAHETKVRVGRDDGIRAEVTGGLSEDDSVVVSYSGSLEDGEPVDAESAEEES